MIAYWAIHIQNVEAIGRWSRIINGHNECPDKNVVGEVILVDSIRRFNNPIQTSKPRDPSGVYLVVLNLGCHWKTTKYLYRHRLNNERILRSSSPGSMPTGWVDNNVDILWMPTLATSKWPNDEALLRLRLQIQN